MGAGSLQFDLFDVRERDRLYLGSEKMRTLPHHRIFMKEKRVEIKCRVVPILPVNADLRAVRNRQLLLIPVFIGDDQFPDPVELHLPEHEETTGREKEGAFGRSRGFDLAAEAVRCQMVC